jgi:hypothetical protein
MKVHVGEEDEMALASAYFEQSDNAERTQSASAPRLNFSQARLPTPLISGRGNFGAAPSARSQIRGVPSARGISSRREPGVRSGTFTARTWGGRTDRGPPMTPGPQPPATEMPTIQQINDSIDNKFKKVRVLKAQGMFDLRDSFSQQVISPLKKSKQAAKTIAKDTVNGLTDFGYKQPPLTPMVAPRTPYWSEYAYRQGEVSTQATHTHDTLTGRRRTRWWNT